MRNVVERPSHRGLPRTGQDTRQRFSSHRPPAMIVLEVHLDANGIPRAAVEPAHEPLAWFLEQDLQSNVAACDELLEHIKLIRSGQETEWEESGNAHVVSLTPQGATIENVYSGDDAAYDIALDDLDHAVRQWLEYVRA